MQLPLFTVLLCIGVTSAAIIRGTPGVGVPEAKVPEAKVPEAKVPEVEKPKVGVHAPEPTCGPTKPWSEHKPFEPDTSDKESMCQACKIRACNANLPMPGDGGKACRCQYSKVGVGASYTTDCKPPFADGVESVGDWSNCPGGVRNCEELEGQCVSATFKMDSAPKPPKVPEMEAPEEAPQMDAPEAPKAPEIKIGKAEAPEVKCGPTKPWSEHTPMEPDVNDYESMCQACKIRACNANLPMPGEGGKACRCQYTKVGDTYQTDCKAPFADGVKSVGEWSNCPGGVRNCEELEGQCVSATFKMDSAPEAPEMKAPDMEKPETPKVPEEVPKVPQSGAAVKSMMPLAALAFSFLA